MTNHTFFIILNCQTSGLTEALQEFLPNCHFHSMEIDKVKILGENDPQKKLIEDADIVITCEKLPEHFLIRGKIQLVPKFIFPAFHPDLTYAKDIKTGQLTRLHYNSKLVVAMWSLGYSSNETNKFFNDSIYNGLGYYDDYSQSVINLTDKFLSCGFALDIIDNLFLKLRSLCPFMHSFNHPMPIVFEHFAKAILSQLGIEPINKGSVFPRDYFYYARFPIYPEIANIYNSKGSYLFVYRKKFIFGVENFVKFMFEEYKSQNISRSELQMLPRSHNEFISKLNNLI